jgi:imidazolonepropionase-like amidohydrolase
MVINAIRTMMLSAAVAMAAANDTFLIRNISVHPVTSAPMENASVMVVDGKIAEIGPKITPPKGTRIIEGKGLRLYPGLIDSATEVGMAEIGSIRESADTGELGDFNPQLRSSIAVNPSSEHIPVTRANGITSVIVLPGGSSENRGFAFGSLNPIINGQSALMRLDGWTWEEMEMKRVAAIQMKFPVIQTMSARAMMMDLPSSFPRTTFADAKRSYDRRIQELRGFFEQARRYQKGKASKEPGLRTDLKFEAMIPVLEGKTPLMVVAARARTIREAIDFADKEKIKIVLAGPDELGDNGPRIKERNIPVILGPTLELPGAEDDPYDAKASLPGQFTKAGIKVAFGSFNTQFARNLPYQAATAVAFGMSYEDALKAVTINPAEIWGVADQVGSIEKGKWADLIITDGDPLETATQIKQMFIKGKSVDLTSKHTKLYEKYMGRQ